MRAPSVYCAPITLTLEEDWSANSSLFEPAWLPSVVAAHAKTDAELMEHGYALLREVVTRRLVKHSLTEDDVFEKGVLDLIITECGGVLSTLIRLVNKSIECPYLDDASHITRESTREAINEPTLRHFSSSERSLAFMATPYSCMSCLGEPISKLLPLSKL